MTTKTITRRALLKLMTSDPCALWHVLPAADTPTQEAWAWIHGRDIVVDEPVRVRSAHGHDFEVTP